MRVIGGILVFLTLENPRSYAIVQKNNFCEKRDKTDENSLKNVFGDYKFLNKPNSA